MGAAMPIGTIGVTLATRIGSGPVEGGGTDGGAAAASGQAVAPAR